jgi:hypothetical protein
MRLQIVDTHEISGQDIFHVVDNADEKLLRRHHAYRFFVYDVMTFCSFKQRYMHNCAVSGNHRWSFHTIYGKKHA